MTLPASQPRRQVSTRQTVFRCFQREDGLWDIEGELLDIKQERFTIRNERSWDGTVAAQKLLSAVLRAAPAARGVLFDLPSVVADASDADGPLTVAGVAQRCDVEGGSFFESVPADGDAYLLKTIIHDWDDERALEILRKIRDAIAPGGKVLLLEMVLPEGAPGHLGLLLDLEMLVSAGGKERTQREYADLLARAGFRLNRVLPTPTPLAIVEAIPV